MFDKHTSARIYIITGATAIIASGLVSAFLAKQPSTFAMWASAYLVLVVGVVQLFFAFALAKLTKAPEKPWKWWFFGLFNTGNALVIAGTALKYAALGQYAFVTAGGGALVVVGLAMFCWQIRGARLVWLKQLVFAIAIVLACTAIIGLFLAGEF